MRAKGASWAGTSCNRFQKLSNTNIINTNTVLYYGYDRCLKTFSPLDARVKIAIDYDINADIEYCVTYKNHSVKIVYSKKDNSKVSSENHILDPLFLIT